MPKKKQKVKTRFDGVYQGEIKNKRFRDKRDVAFEVAYMINGKLKLK